MKDSVAEHKEGWKRFLRHSLLDNAKVSCSRKKNSGDEYVRE